VKITKGDYYGAVCIEVKDVPWLYFDLDLNPRFPYGCCLAVRIGENARSGHEPGCEVRDWEACGCSIMTSPARGFTLDLNAFFGEPNRLSMTTRHRHVTVGLLSWHREEMGVVVRRARCRPHLVRMQGWDSKAGKWLDYRDERSWKWLVIMPRNRQGREEG